MATEDQQIMADRVKLNGHCVESDRGEETVLIELCDNGETSSSSIKKFPKEPKKLLLSVFLLFIAAMTNDVVLAWIHERVPETPPLPDLFFTLVPHFPNALAASEYLIMVSSGIMFIVCLLHRHRWILLRRVFLMLSLLYLGRCVCMLVTQVPVADPTYFCSPKSNNTTFGDVLLRALRLFSGAGLNIFGKHTFCGDYIFSGHTLILVMTYLVVKEYSPRRFWHLHLLTWLVSASGILCILLSRGHYSIDVVIAYFVTTRLFWLYHTLANSAELKVNCICCPDVERVLVFVVSLYGMQRGAVGAKAVRMATVVAEMLQKCLVRWQSFAVKISLLLQAHSLIILLFSLFFFIFFFLHILPSTFLDFYYILQYYLVKLYICICVCICDTLYVPALHKFALVFFSVLLLLLFFFFYL